MQRPMPLDHLGSEGRLVRRQPERVELLQPPDPGLEVAPEPAGRHHQQPTPHREREDERGEHGERCSRRAPDRLGLDVGHRNSRLLRFVL